MEQRYLTTVDHYLFGPSYPNRLHLSFRSTNKLIYLRIGCLIYLTAIYLWSLILMPNIDENIIYLTLESYFITWVYFALTVEDYFANSPDKPEYFRGLWKMCSLLFEVALCAEVPVTLVFWGFLFKIMMDMKVSCKSLHTKPPLSPSTLICTPAPSSA